MSFLDDEFYDLPNIHGPPGALCETPFDPDCVDLL
jgi:hypothetical protein